MPQDVPRFAPALLLIGENMPLRWTLDVERVERTHQMRPVEPRFVHAAACALFEGPERAPQHHQQNKPFAVVPPYSTADGVAWQLTWLGEDALCPAVAVGTEVRFGNQRMAVVRVTCDERSWASLSQAPPVRKAQIDFPTGTTFSRDSRRHYPLPDPETLFAGLLRRWNAFAPAVLRVHSDRVAAFLLDVVLTECEIATRSVVVGQGSRPVFTGTIRVGLVGSSSEHALLLGALLRWAECAGVGALTTHGLGVVEVRTGPGERPG